MDREQRCLALRLPGQPEVAEAERQVRAALGEDVGVLEIECFPGRESTLVLAHPAEGMYISRDAMRFLAGKFGKK